VLQALLELIRTRLVHDQPARGGAALTGRSDRAEDDRRQREAKIGIFVDDHGVVAGAFEQAAAHATGDRARDFAPDAARAGERDQRHALIVDQPACLLRTVADGQREYAYHDRLQHRRVHDVLNCHGVSGAFGDGPPDTTSPHTPR
jgi:hypothetical protein